MALIAGTVQDIEFNRRIAASAPSWVFFNDGFAAASTRMPIIQEGMIPTPEGVSQVDGTDTQLFLVHEANVTVAAYEVLDTTTTTGFVETDACAAGTDSSCAVDEWATNTGVMDGVSINAGQTMDISISASRNTNTSEEAHLEVEVYHRTTGGTETLLDTVVLANLDTDMAFHNFTGTWSVSSDQAFATDELLVIKITNDNTGVPA